MVVDHRARRDQMAAQMQFANDADGNIEQGGQRVFAVVALVHIQIIDVEQQAAAAAARQFGQELRFAHGVGVKAQAGRHIFQQDRPAQGILHPPYPGAQQVQRGACRASAAADR